MTKKQMIDEIYKFRMKKNGESVSKEFMNFYSRKEIQLAYDDQERESGNKFNGGFEK